VTTRQALVAIGAARHLDADLVLDLGDLHPAQHGALQLALELDGDLIVGADARVGLLHRSAEKLFEARDYRQILMLANRHDWLSAFSSELGVALTIEAAMGIVPPVRATWSRTLLAEVNRITASLLLVGAAVAEAAPILGVREDLQELQERATGGRVHPMITRIGGLARPLDTRWLDDLARVLALLTDQLPAVGEAVTTAMQAYAGCAVLTTDDALSIGVSGPVARASGVDLDLRRDAALLAYPELASLIDIPVFVAGDIPARYEVLLGQIPVSIALACAAADRLRELGEGPVNVPLPKVVRVPESTSYGEFEGPLGRSGYLLSSIGEKTPWRLKLRTPSFTNVQALARSLPGTVLHALAPAVTSFFFVVGDIDR
jgi:NADH-quinone oxidoreductase subunit D